MDTADEILSQIPLDQLAQQLGVDEATAEQAVRQAVPALLGGMEANAQDPGGAASLEKALGQHVGGPLEGLDLGSIDTADGEAIVGNVFGDNSEQVINKLGEQSGGSGIMQKLLPILAPIVLNMLAGKFLGQGQGQSAPGQAPGSTPSGGWNGWSRRPHRQCHRSRWLRRRDRRLARWAARWQRGVWRLLGCHRRPSRWVARGRHQGLTRGQAGNSSNSVRILAIRPVHVSMSAGGTSSTSRAAASRMAIPAGEPAPVVTTGFP